MSLTKSKGNMYDWVTHTHTHLRGECPHGCKYCYVQAMERRYHGGHYAGELRLDEESLKINYGSGKTIFIDNCNDLFADGVKAEWIIVVLHQCEKYPDNTYVFQSKNPKRMFYYLKNIMFDFMAGTTIETDINNSGVWSSACPSVIDRFRALNDATQTMSKRWFTKSGLFITVEPILKMADPINFARMIADANPTFVNIGADSKGHGLNEPTAAELRLFIDELNAYGVNIRKKINLDRILRIDAQA